MKLSYSVPELLAYEIYNYLGEMHPVKQHIFETTSKNILISLLVQYHGKLPRFVWKIAFAMKH
jgi:hypothetical protein